MLIQNPQKQYPKVNESAWISETAVIVGDVTIGDNVFVAPNAVIRADEPDSSIVIGNMCNVQDNMVIHALSNSEVIIGSSTSLAHGCIVHGPCRIGNGCFIGFGAVVFDCIIGNDTLVLHNATARGVDIPSGRVIQDGETIIRQEDTKNLGYITQHLADFKEGVVKTNIELVKGYRKCADEA